jgi:hypothetical protein
MRMTQQARKVDCSKKSYTSDDTQRFFLVGEIMSKDGDGCRGQTQIEVWSIQVVRVQYRLTLTAALVLSMARPF